MTDNDEDECEPPNPKRRIPTRQNFSISPKDCQLVPKVYSRSSISLQSIVSVEMQHSISTIQLSKESGKRFKTLTAFRSRGDFFKCNKPCERESNDSIDNFPAFMNDSLDEFNSVRFRVDEHGEKV